MLIQERGIVPFRHQPEIVPDKLKSPGFVLPHGEALDFIGMVGGSTWYKDADGSLLFQTVYREGLMPVLVSGMKTGHGVVGTVGYKAGFGEQAPFYIYNSSRRIPDLQIKFDAWFEGFEERCSLIAQCSDRNRRGQEMKGLCRQVDAPLRYLSRLVDRTEKGKPVVVFSGANGDSNFVRFLGCKESRLGNAVSRLALEMLAREEGGKVIGSSRNGKRQGMHSRGLRFNPVAV